MFKDKVVLVTGGTSGLGFGISKEFLENGAKVIAIVMTRKRQRRKRNFQSGERIFVA